MSLYNNLTLIFHRNSATLNNGHIKNAAFPQDITEEKKYVLLPTVIKQKQTFYFLSP